MTRGLCVVFFTFLFFSVFSQRKREELIQPNAISGNIIELKWRGVLKERISDEVLFEYLYFEGASVDPSNSFLPKYYFTLPVTGDNPTEFRISDEHYEEVAANEFSVIRNAIEEQKISGKVEVLSLVSYYRGKPVLTVSFFPLRKSASGKFEKLVSFRLVPGEKISTGAATSRSGRIYAANSVLSAGTWFKLGVAKDGVYKITHSFLQNMGVDVNAINPQNIRIYGNGGAMLPFQNSQPRLDDLAENSIYVSGENDGKFDPQDFILFYGQGPHRRVADGNNLFRHHQHLYSDTNYYFLTVDLGSGKRILAQPALQNFSKTVVSFNDFDYYEKDLINPLRSGREWLGESFNVVSSYDFLFTFPNLSTESPVMIRTVVAGRTTSGQNVFSVKANGQAVSSIAVAPVSGIYTDTFGRMAEGTGSFSTSSATLNINISMTKGNSGAQGWLDFIEVNVRRKLEMAGTQMLFRDFNSVGQGNAKFKIAGSNSNTVVWNISDFWDPKIQSGTLIGSSFEFAASTDNLKEYIVFDVSAPLYSPSFKEKLTPQNLHASGFADLIIVTHPLFETHAKELAEFHKAEDGLSSIVVTTHQIYNEFSSGKQDVTAIKDFVKMLYDRANGNPAYMPKYLLLFGDGSYDHKDRISGNTNFVPTYQSANSLSPTASYVSDDYFGLLDDNEGDGISDILDLGIGRLVAKNVTEAQNAVNKIKHYYDKKTMGPWRNYNTFIGDDEDNKIHMFQADSIAGIVNTRFKKYNVDKILFDAYKQQVNAGGQRYPDVNAAIDRRIDLGTLMMTYIGHGGELGWAHERILEVSQINKWTNLNNMPLFITATCEFSRFDDPQRTSAGEFVFLNPSGGGIGLLTTTRLVYSSPNFEIVGAFTNAAFDEINSGMPRLGDLLVATKTSGPKNINSRNFTLLGDPALRLAYPKHNITTTSIATNFADTMKALGKVTVKGFVADNNGQKMTDFNGVVYPIVFDKAATINTLNNDGVGVFSFQNQKNIIFKGKASVTNGDFEYSFVVPKDISYTFGKGKISHYAQNGEADASGYFDNFIIGGTDSAAGTDNVGPQIQIFLNDEKFVFGGITDENPKLLVKLFDENGINTTGNGIGHDIVAVLDENTSKSIILNDYYEAEINSYQKGAIRYPLKDLTEGKHTLRLKAFDVYNNSGEAKTEFVVAKSAELALDHVLNYPNPFTTITAFYFEHNQPGQNLDIQIQIFTVSGKLVKTIDSYIYADSFRAGPIYWNGLDDFGDKIGKGVYVYKLKVITPSGKSVNKFEKLVILN